MPLVGRNFFHHNITGLALKPQSLTDAAGTGETIVAPWKKGRQLTFILLGGTFASSSTATCAVQVRKKSDASWTALLNKSGTAVVFTVAKLADAGELEAGHLLGTVPLGEVSAETYNAIRIVYTAAGSAAQLVGAAYVISDLYGTPGGDVAKEDLFGKLVFSPAL